MDKCDVRGYINLDGHVIKINCERVDEHNEHRFVKSLTISEDVQHRNVFEKK
jgi:hypothetical protein